MVELTPAEVEFSKKLTRCRIQFECQKTFSNYRVDFFLPQHGIIIELDGLHHYKNPRKPHRLNLKYEDKVRTKFLESLGFKVVRLTNKQSYRFSTKIFKRALRRSGFSASFRGRNRIGEKTP